MAVSDTTRERITEGIERALRSKARPWPEDPDGFYYSSADMLACWVIEQIEADTA